MREVAIHLSLERRIGLGFVVGFLQIENERHQSFGDEAVAVNTEMPALVRSRPEGIRLLHSHAVLAARSLSIPAIAARAAHIKARIFSGSFSPGARSTPDETSTPGARVMRSASATLLASRPPESMYGTSVSRFCRSRQSKLLPSPPGLVAARGARASKIRRSATPA